MKAGFLALSLWATALAVACAPVDPRVKPANSAAPREAPPARPLVLVLRDEPQDLSDNLAGRATFAKAMFGALLTGADELGVPYPVLASVPQLNTDTWRVTPDGRMETTYRLKPGLTWHDGRPLTADDFVFGAQIRDARNQYGLHLAGTAETVAEPKAIEAVAAPSPAELIIRWRQLHADAATPTLQPMPQHILGEAFERVATQPALLGASPYWTSEWVGTGPYRLTQWEPGAFLEATAFSNYALGRPKIDRIILKWSGDPNTTVTRLLAKDADIAFGFALGFEQALTLRREWSQTAAGLLILSPRTTRFVGAQLRSAFASPRAILDVRVRKASVHAIDRRSLVDVLLEREGQVAEVFALPSEPFYGELLRTAELYPYDLRRTEELMREAGFVKGQDGMYAGLDEGRFAPEVWGIAEGKDGKEVTLVTQMFREAGMDAQLRLFPSVQMQNSNELKATYPAWRINYLATPQKFYGPDAASLENSWAGTNKVGWLNPENVRLVDLYNQALTPDERKQAMLQAYKLMNGDLPGLPLYYDVDVTAHVAELKGPGEALTPNTPIVRNLHEWAWKLHERERSP